MIKGVGIDIVQIKRILNIITKFEDGFLRKVLHLKEIEEYKRISNEKKKTQYLASRWAVKEALVKATGNKSIVFSDVYIDKEESGKPTLKINQNEDDIDYMISISHEDDYAVAVVIVQLNKLL